MSMSLKQKREDTKLTVFIEGSIDTSTAPTLSDYLNNAINGVTDLTLDFEKVEYISSAGLRVLLSVQRSMNGVQGTLTVCHVNDDIMETFELTCITDVINVI